MSITAGLALNELHMYLLSALRARLCRCVLLLFSVHKGLRGRNGQKKKEAERLHDNVCPRLCVCVFETAVR